MLIWIVSRLGSGINDKRKCIHFVKRKYAQSLQMSIGILEYLQTYSSITISLINFYWNSTRHCWGGTLATHMSPKIFFGLQIGKVSMRYFKCQTVLILSISKFLHSQNCTRNTSGSRAVNDFYPKSLWMTTEDSVEISWEEEKRREKATGRCYTIALLTVFHSTNLSLQSLAKIAAADQYNRCH